MKSLANLKPAKGSNKNKKRLGRGPGSGLGKTSGKGHKGQKARKGGKVRPGFEGGQMPLYRRLPKRGFKNPFRVEFNPINLDTLNKFDADTTVTPEVLEKAGLVRKPGNPIKLLGRGKLDKALKVSLQNLVLPQKLQLKRQAVKSRRSNRGTADFIPFGEYEPSPKEDTLHSRFFGTLSNRGSCSHTRG